MYLKKYMKQIVSSYWDLCSCFLQLSVFKSNYSKFLKY